MRDLLGPWAGDAEELPAGTVPSERYILGVLSPARVSLDAEITDDTASDDGSGEGAAEVTAAAAAGSMAPASLGLSFSLPLEVSSVRVPHRGDATCRVNPPPRSPTPGYHGWCGSV